MTPDVRVVRGEPDDVELAALVAGLAAGSVSVADPGAEPAAEAEAQHGARRRWLGAADRLADPLAPGPDAWRWSRA